MIVLPVKEPLVGKATWQSLQQANPLPKCVPAFPDLCAGAARVGREPFALGHFDTTGQDGYNKLRPLTSPQIGASLVCFSVPSVFIWKSERKVDTWNTTVQRLLSCLWGPTLTSDGPPNTETSAKDKQKSVTLETPWKADAAWRLWHVGIILYSHRRT